MKVSILDQGVAFPASGPYESVRETLRLAEFADRTGFERFWVAEHHGPANTCGNPEVLLGALARETYRIRLGSGVSLLPYYAPLRLASAFRTLDYLAPSRIDLGLGKGTGGSEEVARRLGYRLGDYRDMITELRVELRRLTADGYPGDEFAQLWLCGASAESAKLSGSLALRYCFGQFLRPDLVTGVSDAYRGALPNGVSGCFALAVHVLCATSRSDVAAMTAMVSAALPHLAAQRDPADGHPFGHAVVVGTPQTVHEHLARLVAAYRPDELVVTTTCPTFDLRLASFELVEAIARQL